MTMVGLDGKQTDIPEEWLKPKDISGWPDEPIHIVDFYREPGKYSHATATYHPIRMPLYDTETITTQAASTWFTTTTTTAVPTTDFTWHYGTSDNYGNSYTEDTDFFTV